MKQIAKTEYYELEFTPEKNQVFWKIKGFWPSVDAVPSFDSDWNSLEPELTAGFTIMADLTEMKPFPPDVAELNQKKQVELMELGCRKVAQVNTDPFTVMQINRVTKESGMGSIIKAFEKSDDAATWLDEK